MAWTASVQSTPDPPAHALPLLHLPVIEFTSDRGERRRYVPDFAPWPDLGRATDAELRELLDLAAPA